ncbi:MAG: bifunctional lysylphosphatidylglycerol flippase/synthetase MprF [Deltaproteobacteria bacterium]|nr:bifunctional lysylphosphatidylglycerol flippase/synthetase MprF [Deltaproteobacteria bacterium]
MKRESVLIYIQKAAHLLPLFLFGLALFIVHNELKTHHIDHILLSVKGVPVRILAAAVALTASNYIVLAGYDILALRYTGHEQIPVLKILAASLISYSISNNTGHAWAAGGSVRYRFYSAWGIPGWDVLKISLFLTITYFLGILTLGLFSSLLLPRYLLHPIKNPQMIHGLTAICALSLGGYWAAVFFWRKPLIIKGLEFRLPSIGITFGQTLIAAIDVILSSLVLWVFLSSRVETSFTAFLLIFVLAQVSGVISQIPGGIGIFESAFLWLMSAIQSPHHHHPSLIGALLLYRIIYYFLPLILAGGGLLGYEAFARRKALVEGSRVFRRLLSATIPQIYSILLLFFGGILLVSGAIPAKSSAMDWLSGFIPLPVIEISHLLGSLTGLLLLFLARGIRLRIDAAWYGSLMMLAMGTIVSMLKGFYWHESLALSVMLILMLPARSYFRRKSSLFDMPFSRPWILMILIVLAGSTWLGFFAYRNIQYANELWWQFSYKADAPRFLRALLLSAVLTTGYALYYLLTVARPRTLKKPNSGELDEATALISNATDPRGFLALIGDKYLSWSKDRKAFLMFAITPKYWIVMGDPVGDPKAADSLLWHFREQVDLYNAKCVFYQVSDKYLPYYLDLGLSPLKIGEEARVNLAKFSLQGGKHDSQRSARNKFTKKGYYFAILTENELKDSLAVLRNISDQWLLKKHTREKGFSLGFFNEDYLCRTDVAVVYDSSGRIRAFANLWKNINKEELSIDLMRYDPESPSGIMEFLFVELMLWGKMENYQWFSLGMAPLAGLERHPLAPLWHKIGTAIFDLGEEFYNFEGLYEYKAKFEPEWLPRYLAAPAGISAPFILMTVARLISGGWKGIFSK